MAVIPPITNPSFLSSTGLRSHRSSFLTPTLVRFFFFDLPNIKYQASTHLDGEMADSASAPPTGPGKVVRALASLLLIDLTPADLARDPPHVRGQDRTESIAESDSFIEEEPTVLAWVGELQPTGSGIIQYVLSLFPFVSWIHRYNLKWLYGDMVAGITVGCVVIPQGSELKRPE